MKKNGLKKQVFLRSTQLSPGEVLYFLQRKHWAVVIPPLFILLVFLLVLSFIILGLFIFLQISIGIMVLFLSFVFLLTLGIGGKIIIDWLFNFYIITNYKISEIKINPLFSDSISEILLKQVRCTEIDILNNGIINQILNKGNVTITFDRPTHQEEFVLSDIYKPREVGMYLSQALVQSQEGIEKIWFKDIEDKKQYKYTEEINPQRIGGEII